MSKYTPGTWTIDRTHLTHDKDPASGRVAMSIRAKEWSSSDLMGDYRGNIVCSFVDAHGGRFHAFEEADANACLIAAAEASPVCSPKRPEVSE